MDKIETLLIADVARALGTSPAKVKAAIKNGTMPIGMVGQEPGSTQERTVIVRTRWEKWINGQL
jgi:hypothetical protein